MSGDESTMKLVFIGGGHSHVHVLKSLGLSPYRERLERHNVHVTLVTKVLQTPYSGMLPGYVAGHYTYDQIHLNLPQICEFADIELVHAACVRIEHLEEEDGSKKHGLVHLDNGGEPIPFDVLSIDVGSAPGVTEDSIRRHPRLIPVKPIAEFCRFYHNTSERLQAIFQESRGTASSTSPKPRRICVVGGGAAGVELVLSIQYALTTILQNKNLPKDLIQMVLVTRGSTLMEEHNIHVQKAMMRILKERFVEVHRNTTVVGVADDENGASYLQVTGPTTTDEISSQPIAFDECFWCTTAAGASWLSKDTPFPCDERGFLKIEPTFQVQGFSNVFAAGDCATMEKHPRPKAGVFAVRAGPPLLENIMTSLTNNNKLVPLPPYTPQQDFLGIISTGNAYAIASRGKYHCVEGKWVWWWKDWIDRRWMTAYQTMPPKVAKK